MTKENARYELQMALRRLKENGHCDKNRARAFNMAMECLTSNSYFDGFRDGVEDTTKRAEQSISLKEIHIKEFIDYVFDNSVEITLTSDYGLKDFMFDRLKEYINVRGLRE